MLERIEVVIVALVMLAAAPIMLAPLFGRSGAARWADAAMLLASGTGLEAFIVAAVNSCCAARQRGKEEKGGGPDQNHYAPLFSPWHCLIHAHFHRPHHPHPYHDRWSYQ